MDAKEYKIFHELHMMDNSGTSSEECAVLLSIIPFSIFISLWICPHVSKILHFFLEFCIIIVPIIFSCTILSHLNHIILLNLILISITIVIFKVDFNNVKIEMNKKIQEKKNCITNYRASTIFFSTLCILAVDFNVFPKRLAKTESYGFGFMDLGVGFFVCSNGLVEKHEPCQNYFVKMFKSVCLLLNLGLIRLLSVKLLDYHEHITEYGVHWNFFFTLAVCRLICYFLLVATKFINPLWLSVITGIIHQSLLMLGLQNWVFSNAPRDSFIVANKEGISSCLGYVCLYFSASNLGKFILFSKHLTYKKLLFKLIKIFVLTSTSTIIFFKIFGISRKLVNLGYIVWILALTSMELILFVFVELGILDIKKRKAFHNFQSIPLLAESINTNGLFFFILGNLLTGLINLVFQTLHVGKLISMIIIINYMAILCGITYFLYVKKIYLKF